MMPVIARVSLLVALLLAVAGPAAAGRGGKPGAKPRRAQPRIAVVAELVEDGPHLPHCGGMHFIAAMKYRVIQVRSGELEDVVLYAAVSCPEMHPVLFRAGQRHRLVLVRRKPWSTGGLVKVKGKPAPTPLYWALEVEPARLGPPAPNR